MKRQVLIIAIVIAFAAFVARKWGGQPSGPISKVPASAHAAPGPTEAASLAAPVPGGGRPAAGAESAAVRAPARGREELLKLYPEAPRDEIVGSTPLHRELVAELEARYRVQLDRLSREVKASGAHLVVAYLTPEFESDAQKTLEPFIRRTCTEMGVEYVDLTPRLRGRDPLSFTQMPRDGHWSARGANIVALALGEVLDRHASKRSTVVLPGASRPSLFGDLEPGQDVILDGGKNLPYRLETNRQGLRLDHDLAFPKTRQRVLILGDSQIYCPYLDNPDTIPAQLQRIRSDREIVSAANLGYGIDDYVSLFRERARFVEPDLVIVQTGGGDILDGYFSNRNLFNRRGLAVEPTPLEARYHQTLAKSAGGR